ncbi:MAG: radical SAM protein [Deltaproteobacteria bacterium]|nr:radical SAM protein [Deltaproteobacteria bacterium]
MELSRHNILTPVHGSPQWLLANLLSGQADLLDPEVAEPLARGELPPAGAALDELAQKGYAVEPAAEQKAFRQAYLEFVRNRESDEIQLFYVPTYACNFACSYCFQDEYAPRPGQDGAQVLQAFFAYIDSHFAGRRKYVTLFGGEPLLPSHAARAVVEQLVAGTRARGLDLAVVTNGYHLTDYIPLLQQARIRAIQVTLDGPAAVHDARRMLRGGAGTFAQVAQGVTAALQAGMAVNLRAVLDRSNLEAFADLARYAIDAGWTGNPLFKTQIGRNYELHHCQSERAQLYTRLQLFQDLYELIQRRPEVLELHKPAYSVAKFLFERGELPAPLFDSCPACKSEWAFDYTGAIYPCTANVGKTGEAVGRFWPQTELSEPDVAAWHARDVLEIEACGSCNLRLACGGGCGAVAKNQTGQIAAPDCRPVAELLGLGTALYGEFDVG